jgi:hypothetical protein
MRLRGDGALRVTRAGQLVPMTSSAGSVVEFTATAGARYEVREEPYVRIRAQIGVSVIENLVRGRRPQFLRAKEQESGPWQCVRW